MVVPEDVRTALAAHAQDESPNEACGLVVAKNGVAERYVPGRNAAASPYRFELDVPPETWFLEDEGYELAVFHSHLSSPPHPSRTDVLDVGARGAWRRGQVRVEDGELVAIVLEKPGLRGDVELEAIRGPSRVPTPDVALGDAVAEDDEPARLVRSLLLRVRAQLGADVLRDYHHTVRSIERSMSSAAQKSAER